MSESELYKTALNKAMAQCSRREQCCEDVRNKLELWGVGRDDSEKILSVLIKENFINESRFATAFVRDKFHYNKWGKIKISSHLKIKKIPSDIIRAALDSIDNEDYIKLISDLLSSHKKSVKSRSPYELKSKLLRFGLSKGFESSILYDILNHIED